ncbi:MAG: hypothetical protein CMJ78_01980 [Planctomycetaceae bacterium]|nr:hypothetical protein [Planctomycetaceae bacterium]
MVACVLIVLLRVSIGWQFLYEGLWKLNTQSTANPWTAEGYLKNAQGPFRDSFRAMTGDPDDMNWLSSEKVSARWDDWSARFSHHYGLDDKQKRRLSEMLNGVSKFYQPLAALPEGVEFRGSIGKAIKYNAERKRLEVDGKWHFTPRERDRLLKMATVIDATEYEDLSDADKAKNKIAADFHKAVGAMYVRQSRPANASRSGISFKERLVGMLKGDPEKAGSVFPEHKETIDYKRLGDIERYQSELARFNANRAKAQQAFQYDHLDKQYRDLMALKSSVIGPVKSLEKELESEANKILNQDQFALGPVKKAPQPIDNINKMTIWSLVILGVFLIAGLFTRLSAVAGAGMLMMFYFAMPPWPGVPEAPGPEHSFIVNKNVIEAIALLAIAAMPTGRMLGLDALIRRFVLRQKVD